MIQVQPENESVAAAVIGFRPLYRQVRDTLVRRIADGVWRPGQLLPSEPELASDLGVSQGTVRKALDEMTAENLVTRRQGRGTFVAKHDDARMLFQFFKLVPDRGERQVPESRVLRISTEIEPEGAKQLHISIAEPIVVIERLRLLAGTVHVTERICVQAALFPGLETHEAPNNLYDLYSRSFGVTVCRASERLKAVAATASEALHLGASPGDPLLEVDRVAFSLDGRRVEWRVSRCRTDSVHYASDVR
jgi:GntR family transcriptional regulator